jgi:hypothetical protein
MDKINFTLHNFVSFDLQSRIHIVRLRWSNCGSELQCWAGKGLCVLFTPKTVSGCANCLIVDGVVAIGNGNNIFGAVEVAAKVWNCRLRGEGVRAPPAKTSGGAQVNGRYPLMKTVVSTSRSLLDLMVGHPPWGTRISLSSCGAIAVVSLKVFRSGSIVRMTEGRDT